MQYLKTNKAGTEYYWLDDGRLGAIYPSTGYARVSFSMKNFTRPEYKEAQHKRNLNAVLNGTIGKMMKYQINPVKTVEEYHEINVPLYYKFFDREIHYNGQPWRKAYYKMETKKRVLYPGDRQKLYDLLVAFNEKNCK